MLLTVPTGLSVWDDEAAEQQSHIRGMLGPRRPPPDAPGVVERCAPTVMSCPHKTILVIKDNAEKLRCTRCHLTLDAVDLGDACCPECLDVSGRRRYDFEKVSRPEVVAPRYRCDDCGLMLGDEVDQADAGQRGHE